MNYLMYFLILCMGTVFGSFFTLAVHRIPLRQNITHKRSYCPNCNHKLAFLDMIPILSYLFLGGKCRYCKKEIKLRYILLELLSGVVFLLFAVSIKFSVFTLNQDILVYILFGILYISTLFIIAGIDRENIRIEKPVLLFGFICVTLYMVYLYIVEQDSSIYRYVIYMFIICILMTINTIYLRRKTKDNYVIDILLLSILLITFTYEVVYIYTVIFTLLSISIHPLLHNGLNKKIKSHYIKVDKSNSEKIPIGFYMCISNIMALILSNFMIFYL